MEEKEREPKERNRRRRVPHDAAGTTAGLTFCVGTGESVFFADKHEGKTESII
ncbi:hypothetical protein K503DRAFT_145188 [Rhizopogon vinicolor AM-OR11-026]|uniref:Uncharacterized protein n=1 Tax=Rhizopogon vinicolor AM-OR11-026 TaxID=1314800 RepID=A0A1B7N1C9_9AGAM|nr:hypothetical protein K503DRAFT_145188 [Rhizopogon vinicolor AM-OR11-026]